MHTVTFADACGSMQQKIMKAKPNLSASLLHSLTVANNINSILALNKLPYSVASQDHELVYWRQLLHCALRLRCHAHSAQPVLIRKILADSKPHLECSVSTFDQAFNHAEQRAGKADSTLQNFYC